MAFGITLYSPWRSVGVIGVATAAVAFYLVQLLLLRHFNFTLGYAGGSVFFIWRFIYCSATASVALAAFGITLWRLELHFTPRGVQLE